MNSVNLIGAEQVNTAGHRMLVAAEQMANVSANMQTVFSQHQRFLDDWLLRFETVIQRAAASQEERPR